ncbi:YqgE/AlgH family protein [Simkania negevensis]|uniref:UPF0301 protein JYU14_00265 n=1 Tax=Simkania negevensis TaxID=83561 RepID=A0ABS3APE2_9BACT|nr:YqgE/AlgH family protein [Simkania negevensis]
MDPISPYPHLGKGSFLVASPEIEWGIFYRSVLLLCEHNPSGSFGLVINKPLDVELPDELFDSETFVNPHVEIRAGGPVQPNQMLLIHDCTDIPHQTLKVCDGAYLGGDLQFLQKSVSKEEGPKLRLCFGYTGWGSGQLEKEFLEGGWFLSKAKVEYIFDTPVDKIWQAVLRDMGGKYATLSMIPEDLSLN